MAQKNTLDRLENNFWNIAIQLLSESQLTRKLMLVGYTAVNRFHAFPGKWKKIIYAVSGWFIGYLLGLIIFKIIFF
ncbi:MAG: hypothetical protein FVQ83_02585 [Chloroflexi bacterium]|nr:hypothetical protein [Chloroflexota bacterium]